MKAATHSRRSIVVAAAFLLLASACVTSDAVSKFASQSTEALEQGQPVLKDLEGSCIRQHLVEQAIPTNINDVFDPKAFKKAAANPVCAGYAEVQPGELAILKTLTNYFNAISQLATTGTSTEKGDAEAAKNSGQAGNVLAAVSNLSVFLGKVAAGGYQAKHLTNDIRSTDNDVAVVIDALIEIVQQRYVDNQLVSEEHEITETYKDLLRSQGPSPATASLLRAQWERQVTDIGERKAAAAAFIKCLQTIKEGHHKLATEAATIKPTELRAILDPYTDALRSLIPSLQKLR